MRTFLAGTITALLAATMVAIPAVADGAEDSVGVVDQTVGHWYLRDPANGATTSFFFGNPGDFPIMGDWDCDGIDTPGLYRQSDGFVYLRNSNTQGIANIRFFFGDPGDIPLAGDFNADGCDTVSIYRPSEARIFVINELGKNDGGLGAADYSFYFGDPGDKSFTGDFNNNGQDTVDLHRESTGFVYYRNTLTTGIADNDFFYGDPGDQIITGRWAQNPIPVEGTVGIFRPSNGTFYLRFSNSQGNADVFFPYGNSNMAAIAGGFGNLPGGGSPPPTVPPTTTTTQPRPPPSDVSISMSYSSSVVDRWSGSAGSDSVNLSYGSVAGVHRWTGTIGGDRVAVSWSNTSDKWSGTIGSDFVSISFSSAIDTWSGTIGSTPVSLSRAPSAWVGGSGPLTAAALVPIIAGPATSGWDEFWCTVDRIPMWGSVYVVSGYELLPADVTVGEAYDYFADLIVTPVSESGFASSCGQWYFTSSGFADFWVDITTQPFYDLSVFFTRPIP